VVVYVDFDNLDAAGILIGQFIEDGGNHFTGTAPFGPKINKHGGGGLEDRLFEVVGGNGQYVLG
jgi:hypothetical protein